MPGNPSLKGAKRKRAWEWRCTQGCQGQTLWENSLPFPGTSSHFCCWNPNEPLEFHPLGTHCLFSSLCPTPALQRLPKQPHCWVRLKKTDLQFFLMKKDLGWIGICLEGSLVFPPQVHFSAKQFSLLAGSFFFFKLQTEFFLFLLGRKVSCQKFGGNSSFGDPFWVPLPCHVWSPACAAAVLHDISLAGELIHCNNKHTGHTKAGFFFFFCSWINSLRCFTALPHKTTRSPSQGWLLQAGDAPGHDAREFCRWKLGLPRLAHASLHPPASASVLCLDQQLYLIIKHSHFGESRFFF